MNITLHGAITIIYNFLFFHINTLYSVFLACPSSRASECNLHHILKISVMTVDALCHHSFWTPLKIGETIYRLNLHHGLPINPLTQDHQVPVNNVSSVNRSLHVKYNKTLKTLPPHLYESIQLLVRVS